MFYYLLCSQQRFVHPLCFHISKIVEVHYTEDELKGLKEFYTTQLLDDTMPFWFPRSYDHEHGGYLLVRDADGSLIDDDKVFIRRRRLVQLVKKHPYLEWWSVVSNQSKL